jgi:hypothetical protein
MSIRIVEGTEEIQVLYVYKCPGCNYHGESHLAGDGHEGESAQCAKKTINDARKTIYGT